MPDTREYINTTDYKKLSTKLKQLDGILDDLASKLKTSRKLRYAEVNVEDERKEQRLAPDELYIPQHIIDTNIRREQSPYVQYITQSPRAVICSDSVDGSVDLDALDRDLTKKLRFDGWQLSMFANIDGFQANGYGIMEVIQDQNTLGEVSHESVQYGDFAFVSDTRDIQAVEMTARNYYYTRTKLVELCGDGTKEEHWDKEQVDKLVEGEPDSSDDLEGIDPSLFKVTKNMFRVDGIVQVAWTCSEKCDNFLRKPRPLYLGRRKLVQMSKLEQVKAAITGAPPKSEMVFEKDYPYILFPYLISENDTISQLKGRVFLDQDLQEAVSSLLSSTVTQARRASGMYFSKDVSDPNDDLLIQKNIFLRTGCLINAKVSQFQLAPPDPSMFSAINMLITGNQNETSQVNFAVNNRKDSRKTAEEIKTASQQSQILSTVQVVLFSIALTQMYRLMVDVITSRVFCGLLTKKTSQDALPLYQRAFVIKPSGDTDVIEKQQLINTMMSSWSVVQNTPAGPLFLMDLLEMMFPERAAKYNKAILDAQQQSQGQQAQQQQQFLLVAKQMADGIINISKHPEFFSETGKVHSLPALEHGAQQLEALMKQMQPQQKQLTQ